MNVVIVIWVIFCVICYGFGFLLKTTYFAIKNKKYKNLNKIITDFQKSNNKGNKGK